MYTRIFRVNSKQQPKEFKNNDQKYLNGIEEKQFREPTFRKPHTSDLKILLKMVKINKE